MLRCPHAILLPFVPRQELNSSLVDRDRAICERNELLEKYCHEVKDKAEAQKELSQACKDIETVREERDVARKERTEAIIQRDQLLREYYQARQVGNTQHFRIDSMKLAVRHMTKSLVHPRSCQLGDYRMSCLCLPTRWPSQKCRLYT